MPRLSANTSELEAEIDQLCYTLYGLTDEEIAVVEGGLACQWGTGRESQAAGTECGVNCWIIQQFYDTIIAYIR